MGFFIFLKVKGATSWGKIRYFEWVRAEGEAFLFPRFTTPQKFSVRRENCRALISKTASGEPEATFVSLRVATRIGRGPRSFSPFVPLHIFGRKKFAQQLFAFLFRSLPHLACLGSFPRGLEIIERPRSPSRELPS